MPDNLNVLHVKGVQFEGILLEQDHPLANNISGYYHKKHPMALVLPGEIWAVQINNIKMTDNSVGFGKKIKWSRIEKIIAVS